MKLKNCFLIALILIIALFSGCVTQSTQPTESKIIVKQSGGLSMLDPKCADKEWMSNIADYIIEGTVEKVESKWNDERTTINTLTDLKIEKYVKGNPFEEENLQIVTPGGTAEGTTIMVEDQPIFHEGKKVRIYVLKENEEFRIFCAEAGVEEI